MIEFLIGIILGAFLFKTGQTLLDEPDCPRELNGYNCKGDVCECSWRKK